MSGCIEIGGKRVGVGEPTYIIAEMSANHNGSFEIAEQIVQAAAAAGADAVKLQTYTPGTMTIDCDAPMFRVEGGTPWDGRSLHALYAEAATPWEWHAPLKSLANSLGMQLFSTAFDTTAVDFLEDLGVPVHKVASFELVDIPLIRKLASTGRPLIMSTGMATLSEVEEAVDGARKAGGKQIALLKCTSAYPAAPDEANLRTIPHLAEAFDVPVGLSDHTLGAAVAITAVALGSSIVEKHLTLSRASGGPDAGFSLEPLEFRDLVLGIRAAEKALGHVHYGLTAHQGRNRVFRRSLFVVRDVAAGERFTIENIRSVRPAHGLHPRYLNDVIGRTAAHALKRGTPLAWEAVSVTRAAEEGQQQRRDKYV